MNLTIDTGTIILVAEILKAERGADRPHVQDAVEAIKEAVKRMREAGAEHEEDDHD